MCSPSPIQTCDFSYRRLGRWRGVASELFVSRKGRRALLTVRRAKETCGCSGLAWLLERLRLDGGGLKRKRWGQDVSPAPETCSREKHRRGRGDGMWKLCFQPTEPALYVLQRAVGYLVAAAIQRLVCRRQGKAFITFFSLHSRTPYYRSSRGLSQATRGANARDGPLLCLSIFL